MDDLAQARTQLNQVLDEAVERAPLAAIEAVGATERDLAEHRRKAVRAASGRHTWAEIGEAMGVSRQAAHHKYAKEWAKTIKSELKAELRAHKEAMRAGNREAAARAKESRNALIAEVKSARRSRGRRG
jgi:hypothetical protein